jgi:membrane-associated HD superfamily phosphohydrolase
VSKRIQDLTPQPTRWRKAVWAFVSRPFRRLSDVQKFWLGFAFLCVVTTLLLNNPIWRASGETTYKVDDVASESIFSPADIYFVDEEETERLRESAKESVRPIFSSEPKRADEAVQSFRTAWESIERKSAAANAANKPNSNSSTPNRSNTSTRNETASPASGNSDLARVFALRKFSMNELDAVSRVLRESSGGDIYSDQDERNLEGEVSIVDRQRPTDLRASHNPLSTMTKLSEARVGLREGLGRIQSFSGKEADAFATALSPLIQPSIIYDAAATDAARRQAAEKIKPVTISLKRSQKIVGEGQKIDPLILSQISAVRSYASSTRQLNRFIGLLILISALFWGAWKFIEHRGIVPRLALSERKTFALFGFIVVVQTALMAMFFRVADFTASQNVKAPMSDPGLWAFAVPFAMGSLLMTLLADRRTALFTGIFTAILAGFLAPRGLDFAVYAIISSSVSVYGIGPYRSRQTVTLAGVFVGLTGAFLAIALIAYTQQPFILSTVLLAVSCGLASGIITCSADGDVPSAVRIALWNFDRR